MLEPTHRKRTWTDADVSRKSLLLSQFDARVLFTSFGRDLAASLIMGQGFKLRYRLTSYGHRGNFDATLSSQRLLHLLQDELSIESVEQDVRTRIRGNGKVLLLSRAGWVTVSSEHRSEANGKRPYTLHGQPEYCGGNVTRPGSKHWNDSNFVTPPSTLLTKLTAYHDCSVLVREAISKSCDFFLPHAGIAELLSGRSIPAANVNHLHVIFEMLQEIEREGFAFILVSASDASRCIAWLM